jgi:hypothetical protein
VQDQFWKENISKFEEKDFQVCAMHMAAFCTGFLSCRPCLDGRKHGTPACGLFAARRGWPHRPAAFPLLQVLRVLLKLLETSREPKTLAVGCHDLGSFITHYPAGKGLVTGAPTSAPAYSWAPMSQAASRAPGCATQT